MLIHNKKITCQYVEFTVSADHRLEIKGTFGGVMVSKLD